jgi:transmembrane sensor
MLDKEFHIARLIKKQLNSELDEESGEHLKRWIAEDSSNSEFYFRITDPNNFHKKLSDFESVSSEKLWQLTQAKMAEAVPARTRSKPVFLVHRWFKLITAAAIATLIVSVGIWFFVRNQDPNIDQIAYANDVSSGKEGATLTLANGKKIKLTAATNGNVAKEAGVTISKTGNGHLVYTVEGNTQNDDNNINTLTTGKGETYQVQLPDGSQVWLNAASSLTYNSSTIKDGKRAVKLTGEGYFQVAKDKAHPFQVQTGDHQVQVLGTHFNINSYSNEPSITTTLLEGRVEVSYRSNSEVLKPGQQAKLKDKGNFAVTQVDTDPYVAWKNNQFSFENEDIQTIMRMVERWYDVNVEYRGSLSGEKFWGGVSRFDNVSKVLKALESTGKVHFEVKGKTIYVYKDDL